MHNVRRILTTQEAHNLLKSLCNQCTQCTKNQVLFALNKT